MDHSEAAHSWGLEALSCKSSIFLILISLLIFVYLLALRRLLVQMNEHRNAGNVNAALAQHHFHKFDKLFEEFTSRLHRLASEDHPGALVDAMFNEEKVLFLINHFMKEITLNRHEAATPVELEVVFKSLIENMELTGRFRDSSTPPLPPSAVNPPPEPSLEEYYEEVRALGDFIDEQAEEMPDDYESQPEQEEEFDKDDDMSE